VSLILDKITSLRQWMFEAALPFWWERGADRTHGGFYEKIDLDGTPLDHPRRFRVIARQAYSYCEAGRLGWNGPWLEASLWALEYLSRQFIAQDGTVISVVAPDGIAVDSRFDLYNQAFALLAFATGQRCEGAESQWRDRARRLRNRLNEAYAHPHAGYHNSSGGLSPLQSNPHMHLLEAAMAWMVIDQDPAWRKMADQIAELALTRFIDAQTGALREFFAPDWSPASGVEGQIVEPGHQYEWAFLLNHWASLTARTRPTAVHRLISFADAHGVDRQRKVAINSLLVDGAVNDAKARLWPQTERIRAYAIDDAAINNGHMQQAIEGLMRYFETKVRGLWFDQLNPDDEMIIEPSPASSLYHILGAVAELSKVESRMTRNVRCTAVAGT
jgi:mannose/cellobiose epimerase-like protein (N-acyl-D-glucosamine 2-epimerase family)